MISLTPIEKLCQLMIAPAVLVIVRVLPDVAKLALPETTVPPVGLARACVAERLKHAATDSAISFGLEAVPACLLVTGHRRLPNQKLTAAAKCARQVAALARARILRDARHVEPERERFAAVRANAQAEAAELVVGVRCGRVVVPARGVGEDQRARAPGAAEPRAEIRAVRLERGAPADVVRDLALVVAAHAVDAAHAVLLAGDEERRATAARSRPRAG